MREWTTYNQMLISCTSPLVIYPGLFQESHTVHVKLTYERKHEHKTKFKTRRKRKCLCKLSKKINRHASKHTKKEENMHARKQLKENTTPTPKLIVHGSSHVK